jgi:hypothetical protein
LADRCRRRPEHRCPVRAARTVKTTPRWWRTALSVLAGWAASPSRFGC